MSETGAAGERRGAGRANRPRTPRPCVARRASDHLPQCAPAAKRWLRRPEPCGTVPRFLSAKTDMTSEFGGDLFGDEPPPPTPPKKTGGKDRSTSVQKVHLKSRARAEAADDLLFPPAGEHAAEEPTPAPRREEPRRHEARREEGRRTEARGDEPRRHERRDESRREGRGQRERQGQEQGARGAGAEAQPRGEGERERGRGGHERRERGRHGQERAAERR